jgi:hypothetical protein
MFSLRQNSASFLICSCGKSTIVRTTISSRVITPSQAELKEIHRVAPNHFVQEKSWTNVPGWIACRRIQSARAPAQSNSESIRETTQAHIGRENYRQVVACDAAASLYFLNAVA